jgi:hypothetical protein
MAIRVLSKVLCGLPPDQENDEARIQIAFQILDLYCRLPKKTNTDVANCCSAAMSLAANTSTDFGFRTTEFLVRHEHELPSEVVSILRAYILKMAGS